MSGTHLVARLTSFLSASNSITKDHEIHESISPYERLILKKAVSKFTFSAFPCLSEEETSFCFFQNRTAEPLVQVRHHFLETRNWKQGTVVVDTEEEDHQAVANNTCQHAHRGVLRVSGCRQGRGSQQSASPHVCGAEHVFQKKLLSWS